MKLRLLLAGLLLQGALFAAEKKQEDNTRYFNVYCIDGLEFVEDSNGTLTQIMTPSSYKLQSVDPIPVMLPKQCSGTAKQYKAGRAYEL